MAVTTSAPAFQISLDRSGQVLVDEVYGVVADGKVGHVGVTIAVHVDASNPEIWALEQEAMEFIVASVNAIVSTAESLPGCPDPVLVAAALPRLAAASFTLREALSALTNPREGE